MRNNLFKNLACAIVEIDSTITQLKSQYEQMSVDERKELAELLGALVVDVKIIDTGLSELYAKVSAECIQSPVS